MTLLVRENLSNKEIELMKYIQDLQTNLANVIGHAQFVDDNFNISYALLEDAKKCLNKPYLHLFL